MTQHELPDPDAEDKTAMERLRLGDDLALNALMRRWEQPLLSFLYRYTLNWSVAQDLTEETFVRVYQQRHRYRPKGSFSTWIFTIAANLAKNEARWRRRHPGSNLTQPSDEGEWDALSAETPSPDDSATRSEDAESVRKAIGKLSPDDRAVILLSIYEDRSHAEIGEILGCSAKAVESRLYRARQELKSLLQDLR